jgi:hypothetical protein
MANTTLRGFRWHSAKNGAKAPPVRVVHVADDYATKLVRGDALKFVTDGLERAAAGDTVICGVMIGVKQYWDGTFRKRGRYLPASTSYDTDLTKQSLVEFIPVGGQVFEVDADDGTTATTEAAYLALINENCDHIVESGTLNISYMALDVSTHITATAQWRIVGVSKRVNQDFASSRVKLLVECNESAEPTYATAGS